MTNQPATPSRVPRRALALALLGGALGAAVVLVTAGQTWGEAEAAAAGGALPVSVSGSAVSGLPSALALVGLASLVAVFAVRRTGRRVVAAVLTLSGVGAVAGSVFGARDTTALYAEAGEVTALTEATLSGITHTGWPWVSVAGGLLLCGAGLLALRYGRQWPAMSGRYERAPRRPVAAVAERPDEMWKALDRGEDPT